MEMTAIIVAFLTIVFLLQPLINVSYIISHSPYNILLSWMFHASFKHYFYNIISFAFFGVVAEKELGRWYLPFILSSAIATGFAGSLFYSSFLGFSGVVYAVIGYLVVKKPFMMTIGFGAPFPLVVSAVLWLIQDYFGLIYNISNVGYAVHISGMAFGIVVAVAELVLVHMNPSSGEVESPEHPAPGEDGEEL